MLSKNKIIVFSLVIFGVLLILISSFGGSKSTKPTYDDYVNALEDKIERFLKEVNKIKEADVIITLESYDSNESANELFDSSNGSMEAIIPRVRGVAVACTNGDNYEVQVTVTEIISRYLGIPTNRIKIVAID